MYVCMYTYKTITFFDVQVTMREGGEQGTEWYK